MRHPFSQRVLTAAARTFVRHPRLALATKTAVAAMAAWAVANAIPVQTGQYTYFAPLGAVVATSFTLVGSLQNSLRSVMAIVLGGLVALGVSAVAGFEVITVAVVVAIGVLVAGWRRLGEMGIWVPTTALFVLVIGHGDPLRYATAYAGLVLLGALIGIGVNYLAPPLPMVSVRTVLSQLRGLVAEQFDQLADGLENGSPLSRAQWQERSSSLTPLVARMRTSLRHTEEGARVNPRSARHRRDLERLREHAQASERLAFLSEQMRVLVTEGERYENDVVSLGPELRPPAARTLRSIAEVLRSQHGDTLEAGQAEADSASQHLNELATAVDSMQAPDVDLFDAAGIVVNLRKCLEMIARPIQH